MNLDPFGPADGSSLPAEDLLPVHDPQLRVALARARSQLVVARSGVGKTCFLRRLRRELVLAHPDSLIPDIQVGAPRHAEVSPVEALVPPTALRATWAAIWHRAFIRAFATQLMCPPGAKHLPHWTDEFDLRHDFPGVLRDAASCHRPLSVWNQVGAIVRGVQTRLELRAYLEQPEWRRLQYRIGRLLPAAAPMCLFVDLVDEHMAALPGAWSTCQHGLLTAIAALNDSELGVHLRLYATTRDQHLLSLLNDGPDPRPSDDVLILESDATALQTFCHDKLARILSDSERTDVDSAIARLLGFTKYRHSQSGYVEHAIDLVIRHTRCTPRDVIIVANAFARQYVGEAHRSALGEARVARTLLGYSRFFGAEQITACSQHLVAQLPSSQALTEHAIYTTSTPGGSGHPRMRQRLYALLGAMEVDRFDMQHLRPAEAKAFGSLVVNLSDLLWQNRLLGREVAASSNAAFFSLQHSQRHWSFDADCVVHPCVADEVGLRRVHASPTVPHTDGHRAPINGSGS